MTPLEVLRHTQAAGWREKKRASREAWRMARLIQVWSSKPRSFQRLYASLYEELTGEEPLGREIEADEELLAESRARAAKWRAEQNGL